MESHRLGPKRIDSTSQSLESQSSGSKSVVGPREWWIEPHSKAYTQGDRAISWCDEVRGLRPVFACAMGFTETALIPGISAAGATPAARRYTAIADAEMLLQGYSSRLPTAPEGFPSPVVIAQAICQGLEIPTLVFDCG